MLKKSTVFNFLYIFQLIQKVLTSNFLNLVLDIHICLYKNSNILFLLEKNNFQVKISTFFFSQTPKSKAIFGIFVPSCPKSARNKVYQINLNFSKIQSAAMSVDVSLRSKKRITVQWYDITKFFLAFPLCTSPYWDETISKVTFYSFKFSRVFKLKQSCFKLLVICHVVTFENSNQIKLLQIASD